MRAESIRPAKSGSYGRLHLRLAERLEHGGEDAGAVQPRLGDLPLRLLVVDEAVRHRHRAELQALVEAAFPGLELNAHRGDTADGAFLHRHHPFVLPPPPPPCRAPRALV